MSDLSEFMRNLPAAETGHQRITAANSLPRQIINTFQALTAGHLLGREAGMIKLNWKRDNFSLFYGLCFCIKCLKVQHFAS